jgi:hypothetical protein
MCGRKELRRIFGAARDELRKAGENKPSEELCNFFTKYC